MKSKFIIIKKDDDGAIHFHNGGDTSRKRVVLWCCYSKSQMYVTEGEHKTGVKYWISPGWAAKYSGKLLFRVYDIASDKLELEVEHEYKIGMKRVPVVNGKPFYFKGGKKDFIYHILREIWWTKDYERDFVKVEKDDIVVDVGANLGVFTAYAQTSYPKHIYCLEPMPETFEYLSDNLKTFNNITLINKAINSDGKDEVFINSTNNLINASKKVADNFGNYMAINNERENWNEVTVSAITINDFIKEYDIPKIDFLKVDCEGGEWDMFKTIDKDYLRNNITKIALEYHSEKIFKYINNTLKEQGFIIEHTSGRKTDGMILAYNPNLIIK